MIVIWLALSLFALVPAHAVDHAGPPPEEAASPAAEQESGAGPAVGVIALGLLAITAGAVGVSRVQAAEETP